ncbi:MAG: hypothetical protein QOI76_2276 [Frankiales bacterium]|nr:hypothetical protein [Frankiales bacterium]MDX6255091.1 hypothetical protein [Frankiales bacterium]
MDVEADFAGFVASRQRTLLRSAWLLTGDWALAQDLVQTALARAWPHWSRIVAADATDAYVRRVMINTASGWGRRRWRAEIPAGVLPERAAPREESDRDVRLDLVEAIRRLPPRQRAVIVLRFFDDVTEEQAAAILGCSKGTIKSQTSKALAGLRRQPNLSNLNTVGEPG